MKTKSEVEWHVQFVVRNYLQCSARLHIRLLLLTIFLCNLFKIFVDLDNSNYAGDNTPHSQGFQLSF